MALIRSGRLMRNRPRSWLGLVRREAAWRTKCSSLASQDRSGKQPVRQQGREGVGLGNGEPPPPPLDRERQESRCAQIVSEEAPAAQSTSGLAARGK